MLINIIVILLLVMLVGSAVTYIIRAKRSGVKCIGCPAGGSCPGSAGIPKKKLDGPVIGKKTIRISGMHCQNCVNSVTNALNALDGVSAKVSLNDASAEVVFDRETEESSLKQAVEGVGFKVEGIS